MRKRYPLWKNERNLSCKKEVADKMSLRGLSGRVLDLRPRGWLLEPQQRHCVVSLSKTLYPLLSTGLTQEMSGHN